MTNRYRKTGVSLIEVLVVLVLLLIGILSVIRLFPPGFLINKRVAEATEADNLAIEESDRFANAAANLMDDIIPLTYNQQSQTIAFDPTITPDNLTDADPNAYGNFAYYFSNANRMRHIVGEQVRIPVPTQTTLGRGSVYMLSSGPFMDVQWTPNTPHISIYGAPMSKQPVPQPGLGQPKPYPSQFLRPSAYSLDTNDPTYGIAIAIAPANVPRQFKLRYSYYDASNHVQTVVNQTFPDPQDFPSGILPANYDDWVPVRLPQGNLGIVLDSDALARQFTEINPQTTPWSASDPYQFYLDPVNSPRIGGASGPAANFGVIVFNPLGHDYTEYTASGPVPLTAHIDYDVMDWHIVHEDRPLPATPPYQVPLALTDLKKVGDVEADQSVYVDLFVNVDRSQVASPFNQTADMVVYNTTTGQFVPPTDSGTGLANYTVDYKNGKVTFTNTYVQNNNAQSTTFRFFYKAHGDWALQIQKPSTAYTQVIPQANQAVNLSYGQYYLGTGAPGAGRATRMYFPLCDAGMTVSVREYWYTNGSGQAIRVNNETYQINSNRANFETLTANGGTQLFTYIDIATPDRHPDATAWDYTGAGFGATGVQGISFRSRVIWNDGGNVSGNGANNQFNRRWRKIDRDTFLSRTQ